MDIVNTTPREEKIIRMMLVIDEKTDFTLDEVGDVFGVTRERIRQIEARALRKLPKITWRERRVVLLPLKTRWSTGLCPIGQWVTRPSESK